MVEVVCCHRVNVNVMAFLNIKAKLSAGHWSLQSVTALGHSADAESEIAACHAHSRACLPWHAANKTQLRTELVTKTNLETSVKDHLHKT